MGVYGQYVDDNSDVSDFWESAKKGTNAQASYSDSDYANWINRVLNTDSNFKDIWTNPANAQYTAYHAAFKSDAELGKAHFGYHGWCNVPFTFSISGVQYDGSSNTSRENWGYNHWINNGSKERRVLPGAKLGYVNGRLAVVNSSSIGEPLQATYQDIVNKFNNTSGGNYNSLITNLSLPSAVTKDFANNGDLNTVSSYYVSNKVSVWDARSLGAQPPTGGFDADYYAQNTNSGRQALQDWNNAQTSIYLGGKYIPDLDITGRYSQGTYLQWNYTTQGKAAGERGNAAETAELPENYQEYLTDADYQLYRDNVLGLTKQFTDLQDWASAQDPEALNAWYDALPADQKQQYKEGTLPIPNEDTVPDRLKPVIKLNKGPNTILEGELSTVLGPKEEEQQNMFGALTYDSLKQAAAELKKQTQNQQQFDFYKALPGLNEILTINESLANSLLGDSGVGGVFGWMGDPEKTKESLQKDLSAATGISSYNSTVYNWQKWFDEQLVSRYSEGFQFVDPEDPNKTYTLDASFAQDYIDRYLKPRFDTSRSMSEFVSYMDVKQNEQNIFQTQSALDALRTIGDLRSKAYLDGIKSTAPLNFNANFYINPTGNFTEDDPKIAKYTQQKEEVAADWETAKTNGNALVPGTNWTWNQWAYYYGLNISDQNQFAKLHYQVKGAASGFDPAHDLITLKDAEDYIQQSVLPVVADEKLNLKDIAFLNFVTPEEFADKMLEGISPEGHKEEWDKLLETLGLSGKDMGIEEVKQYIIDAFRTGAAKDIRESIKYLNEKQLTPTQERLGIDYIERPEDAKPVTDPQATSLYKIFQQAGYQGNEDDFYNNFMTDVDRGEMELITQAGKGFETSSVFSGLTSKDPFESLVSIQSLFDDEETTSTSSSQTKNSTGSSYFTLFDEDTTDTDTNYKSKSGEKILGEFTSFFKGFS